MKKYKLKLLVRIEKNWIKDEIRVISVMQYDSDIFQSRYNFTSVKLRIYLLYLLHKF